MNRRTTPVLIAPLLLLAVALRAQEKLEVDPPEPGTIRLGDTSRVMIRIEGRTADPREPKVPAVDGLQMRLSAPTRSSYTFYDGRALVERVGVQYVLELRPTRVGTHVVPPFPIWTGTREQLTPELRLETRQDLVGGELGFLDVQVEPQRVYVHEPVRIRCDYGIQQGVRLVQDFTQNTRYLDIELMATWLSQFPGGEPIEMAEPRGDRRVAICNRSLIYAQYDGNFERDGKRWQHFTFERAFLPTRLGRIELPAPMLRFHILREQGRQDIGRTRGGLSENYYVYGKPVVLEVLPIPEEGRPKPYFGAVGRFAIEARLDRDVVRVGDSVKLTVTARGQGNFDFLRMPDLDDLPGFHKLGENEVQRDMNSVAITYDLTPLSAEVRQIPAIAWNYFDTTPGVEKFVEVETAPLALTVEAIKDGEALPGLMAERNAVTPGVDDVFDLPAFDGTPVLLTSPPLWQRWLCVLAPWLLVGGAFVGWRRHRRAALDVSGQRARGAGKRFEASLRGGAEALDALAGYLGDRLDVAAAAVISPDLAERLLARGLDERLATEIAAAVERGTAARYGGGAALTTDEVRGLVRRLEPARFGARSLLPLWLWPLVIWLCGAGDLRAQSADPERLAADPERQAIAAYRAGDYAAADAAFERAFAASGDRRHLRARGNCLFRLGDLPRARWAYESARLGLPRDAELLANLRLVRTSLDLPEAQRGFGGEVQAIVDRLLPGERLAVCSACMLLAAFCLIFGWRRVAWRWPGALCLVPGAWLAVDLIWVAPNRAAHAIALESLALTSEPRTGLPPVATVRPGVEVTLRGRGDGSFVRVDVGERSGYVPSSAVMVIE